MQRDRPAGDGPWSVFLSHTSELGSHPSDRSYVAAAAAAVIRSGHAVTDMGYFTARDSAPADYCTRMVEQADVYVGIIGLRYGAPVPDRPDLSYTELEFETATALDMPRLVFLVRDEAACLLPRDQPDEHRQSQEAFRRRLLESRVTVAWVGSPADLELCLLHALLELRADRRPPRGSGKTRTRALQLPLDIGDFTGRAREVDALLDAFDPRHEAHGGPRICTIAGKPGVGKSALAIHVAHRLADRHPDVQLYVDLRGHGKDRRTPASVLAAFLQSLGCDAETVPSDAGQRAALYRSLLADRRALVVLDNARDERQVRPLLPGSASCAVLVTSRRRLTALSASCTCDLDDMETDDAIALLSRIAGPDRVGPERRAAEAIVDLCGRLPLAIRIVGAILGGKPHRTLRAMVERLADERRRIDELSVGDLDVRASFALSYRDLTPEQAGAFRLLSLLPGHDFSLPIAAALLDVEQPEAERLVDRLHEAQLVLAPEAGRFRLHDLLRLFGRELAGEHDPPDRRMEAVERALGAYLARAEANASAIRGQRSSGGPPGHLTMRPSGAMRSALAWFEREWPGLVSAIHWAHREGRWELTVRLAEALQPFCIVHAHWTEQERTQRLALDAARMLDDRIAEARCLDHLGMFYRVMARGQDSVDCYTRSVELFRSLGEHAGEAQSLNGLGGAYRVQGRLREALAHQERSMAMYRAAGDRLGEAYVLNSLGIVRANMGCPEAAAGCYQRSIEIVREEGDAHAECNATINLGDLHASLGQHDEAFRCFRRAIAITRSLGDRSCETWARAGLGDVHRVAGRWRQAIACCQRSLAQCVDFGDLTGQARVLTIMGDTYRDQGSWADAAGCYDRAVAIHRRLGMLQHEAVVLCELAVGRHRLGQHREAVEALEASIALARQIADEVSERRAAALLAELSHTDQQPD